ncbi:MAG TPA: nuclear transport factor 2 family protein [Thermomicrobiaceae bacterium]|nr:nuclear transport factor 2 family protein [Thermomicrobiaceae bacterium]
MEERATAPVEVVRAVITALNRGDVETALSYCHPEIVLWAPGQLLEGQEIQGRERLRYVLEYSEARWPDMWTSVQSIVASGGRVAVELTSVASEAGQTIAQPMAAFYTVEGGLIVEQRSYYDLGALERMLKR